MKKQILDTIKSFGLNPEDFKLSYHKNLARPFRFSDGSVAFEFSIERKECLFYKSTVKGTDPELVIEV